MTHTKTLFYAHSCVHFLISVPLAGILQVQTHSPKYIHFDLPTYVLHQARKYQVERTNEQQNDAQSKSKLERSIASKTHHHCNHTIRQKYFVP